MLAGFIDDIKRNQDKGSNLKVSCCKKHVRNHIIRGSKCWKKKLMLWYQPISYTTSCPTWVDNQNSSYMCTHQYCVMTHSILPPICATLPHCLISLERSLRNYTNNMDIRQPNNIVRSIHAMYVNILSTIFFFIFKKRY